MKKINGICLITQDVPRLRNFYRQVLETNSEGDETFSIFRLEGTQLSVCHEKIVEQMAPGWAPGASGGSSTLEIEVEDVDTEYRRLTSLQVPIVKPPTTQPWGLRSVWFGDPDGNLINFYASASSQKSTEQK